MVRSFVALELSKDIRDQLALAQDTIRGCKARLTFVDPKNIHITVKFLGEVDEERLGKVMTALRSIPFLPFTIKAGAVTVNNPSNPRTVWCAIDDSGKGEQIVSRVENALRPLGFEPEKRRFTPHATLARVKSSDPSLLSTLDTMKTKTFGSCTISGLTLKKSILLPRGPVYEDLMEVKW
jgi:RNA 2',3'-cyclic 3'-phosphodiesterase